MKPDRWMELKQLFSDCLDRPPAERLLWLRCQTNDETLIERVLRLVADHQSAGESFLNDSPPLPRDLPQPDLFQPGEMVAGRYRVSRLLGRGGMGEVYQAADTELGEEIALKVLPLGRGDGEAMARRFRRELQLARRISHPNVCRMFDIQKHRSSGAEYLLLTMELVRGETLTAYLRRRGVIAPVEAWPVVDQILAGLEAVHGLGIVHRDLKPSNVMLEGLESGVRAVLMDFGLAVSPWMLKSEEALTESGHLLGTPEYMAPEQLQGGEVTPSTDYYSLGLLLFEMAAGHRPLEAGTPLATAIRRLTEDIGPAVRSLDSPWRTAIEQCLERDPSRRPASIAEIRSLLGGIVSESWRARNPSRRRLLIGSAAAAVSFSAVAFRYWNRAPTVKSSTVLLAPLVNETGRAEFDNISHVFREVLSQSPYLEIVREDRVTDALERMSRKPADIATPAIAREAALRSGARLVAYGRYAGQSLRMKLEMIGARPDTVERTWDRAFAAPGRQALFRALRDAGLWLRSVAGEAERDIRENDRSPLDLTTSDWDALNRYVQAHERSRAGDPEGAEVLYREAIGIDPNFASAHRDLADLLVSEYRYKEGFAEYDRALKVAAERKLSHWERYRLEAMYWDDAWDWEKAVERYRTWSVHYPKDYVPVYYLGAKLAGLGRTEEAAARFEQVVRMSNYMGAHEALSVIAMVDGRWNTAADEIRALRRLGENDRAAFRDCQLSFVRGEAGNAHAASAALVRSISPDWARRGRYIDGLLLAEDGRWPEAQEAFDDYLRQARAAGDRGQQARAQLARGFALLTRGERGAVVEHAEAALAAEPGPRVSARAAYLLSRIGDVAALRRLEAAARDWPQLPLFDAARHTIEGERMLATGRGDAISAFRRADRLTPLIYPRDFLAFALDRVGRSGAARELYGALASKRILLWREPEDQWPGSVRICSERFNQLR